MYGVFNEKQMYDSVIKRKENASKDWDFIASIFLISVNIYLVFG